jgi:glycosyltransferase involved in cell wall biosynthesis
VAQKINMALAPVVIFAYNRPKHLQQTLEALSLNVLASETELRIYIDGSKENASDEQTKKIEEVRHIANNISWSKSLSVFESPINKGLSASVIHGVTETLDLFGKVIVLEDDMISDKWFLTFLNEALTQYEAKTDVACVSGYIYPVTSKLPETFFLQGADCWGWGTWKRAWQELNTNGAELLQELEKEQLTRHFDFDGSYAYTQMLRDQIQKKNNSWAILWYASAYLKNRFTLYPSHSLIHNTGIDGSGTHNERSDKFDVQLKHQKIMVANGNVQEDKEARKIVTEYFRSLHQKHRGLIAFIHKCLGWIKG